MLRVLEEARAGEGELAHRTRHYRSRREPTHKAVVTPAGGWCGRTRQRVCETRRRRRRGSWAARSSPRTLHGRTKKAKKASSSRAPAKSRGREAGSVIRLKGS